MNERVSKIKYKVNNQTEVYNRIVANFDNFSELILLPEPPIPSCKSYTLIPAASNSILQPAHTSAGRPPTSTVGQKGPGLLSIFMDSASVREGGVNMVNAAMQSPGSIASQVLMTASHVSFSLLCLLVLRQLPVVWLSLPRP